MRKIILTLIISLLFINYSQSKEFKIDPALTFLLNDDWFISNELDIDKLVDKSSIENKDYLKNILNMSQVNNFLILYNEQYIPDFITITKQEIPANLVINEKNVKQHCNGILEINAKALNHNKAKLYKCNYLTNPLSPRGALYMSSEDTISKELKDVRVNQIITIYKNLAFTFATSCSDYCDDVTKNLGLIISTLEPK